MTKPKIDKEGRAHDELQLVMLAMRSAGKTTRQVEAKTGVRRDLVKAQTNHIRRADTAAHGGKDAGWW